jgi:hypothetical protein
MAENFVSKIFWPLGIKADSGLLIGWNIRNFNGCICTVLANVEVRAHIALNVSAR